MIIDYIATIIRSRIVGADDTIASVEARKQTPTGNALNVQIGPGDPISNIPVVMDFEHHQNHEGETYRTEYYDTALDTNTVKFLLTVPVYANTIYAPHLVINCDVFNGNALVQLYEGATATGGTDMTVFNRNRNVAMNAGMTVKRGVTSTNGTLIETFFVGAGKGGAATGRAANEIVLKSNTLYRVDVIGLALNTDAITSFTWYEDIGV